jgi:hypothetical protein
MSDQSKENEKHVIHFSVDDEKVITSEDELTASAILRLAGKCVWVAA